MTDESVVIDNGQTYVSEETAIIATEAAKQAKQWAEESERQANIATSNADTAVDAKDLAEEWAIKTDGKVDGTDYSAKYYAQSILPIASDITTVAGISSNVTTVAGIASDVSDVADIASDVTAVKNNSTNINKVANDINRVDLVADDITSVHTVAVDISNVIDVADNKTNIDTVASDSTAINTCANNITSINNAPTYADNAYKWAEGTDAQVQALGGTHSAKEWAQQENGNISCISTGSTTSRLIKDRFADVINVKDFGAKGDGVTDDTAAIQAAINAAGDNQIVFFPGGEEFFVTTILINKEITLRGGRIKSNGTAIDINTSGLSGQKGTLIEGMEINAGQIGIKLSYAGGVSIINCEILNAKQYGIYINSYNELYVNNVRITCSDGTATGRGIFVGASDSVFTNILVYGYGVCIEDTGSNRFTNVHGWIDTTKFTTAEVARTAFIKTNGYSQLTQCVADSYARSIWITGQYARPIINEFTVLHGSDTVWSSVVPEIYHLNDADDVQEEGSGSVVTYKYNLIYATYLIDRNLSNIAQKFINYTGSVYIVDFYKTNVLNYNTSNAPVKTDVIRTEVTTNSYGSLAFLEKNTDKPAGYLRVGEDSTGKPYTQIGTYSLNSQGVQYLKVGGGYIETNLSMIPTLDNFSNLGISSNRWKEVFAGTGTINTSDERQKQNIEDIDEAVFRAWEKVDFKQFRFKEAVNTKGENARIHFGVIAQRVKEAFESEGLDGFKYGLLCYDEWEDKYENIEVIDKEAEYDEDGNEIVSAKIHTEKKLITAAGNAYGIRYSEALALECAYQRWKLEQMQKQLDKILNKDYSDNELTL